MSNDATLTETNALLETFRQHKEEDIAYLKSERHILLMRLAAVEKRLKAYGVEFKQKEGK
jgi:hypothetical protein